MPFHKLQNAHIEVWYSILHYLLHTVCKYTYLQIGFTNTNPIHKQITLLDQGSYSWLRCLSLPTKCAHIASSTYVGSSCVMFHIWGLYVLYESQAM